MKKPTSIRSWAAWPATAGIPDGHQPLLLSQARPLAGSARPLCIGHRGARGLAAENTLRSVRAALMAGVDAIEVDVWQVDGELVVIHDQRVDRTTSGVGYVHDFNLYDLRMLDAGDYQRIPLLEEVIQLVDGRCAINIELKGPDCAEPAVEAAIAALRTERWQPEQFIISSFDHAQLARVRELSPTMRLGLLLCGAPVDLISYAQQLDVWAVHFAVDFAREDWIKAIQQAGIWAFAYTANDACDVARLTAMGIDGLFTDYPDRVMAQLKPKQLTAA